MTPIDHLLDLFLQCRFGELIEKCNGLPSNNFAAITYKANAYYERHQIREAKELLAAAAAKRSLEFDEDLCYVQARMHYFEDELGLALQKFSRIIECSNLKVQRIKGLLGVANVFYSQERFEKIPAIIEELYQFGEMRPEHLIALKIFEGNYWLNGPKDFLQAQNFFREALKLSAKYSWSYYIGRSLYGLASVAQAEGKREAMQARVDILLSFVEESESLYLQYLINEKFKENNFNVNKEIVFDANERRISMGGVWVELHHSPLIFDFLFYLKAKEGFTTKMELAEHLWKGEDYNPEIHDPRIFDLAKRIRKKIEQYENKPLILLSGSRGYKLAGV